MTMEFISIISIDDTADLRPPSVEVVERIMLEAILTEVAKDNHLDKHNLMKDAKISIRVGDERQHDDPTRLPDQPGPHPET